ncbi:hypothetical protein PILCRDRAFT_15481 [Piloderma croceum F 1598]|uniref:Uncharacterized protein n=1 Tax=Piloderma croceum (strain F 1598) TaxID=765440 RepID=A0A0C3B786_PILCF|nr:hypothetical protein PILCRDRAFT_15481 [Piloderma croceum F 1598]
MSAIFKNSEDLGDESTYGFFLQYDEDVERATGSTEIREDFIFNLSCISQLIGFSDPTYADAYFKMHGFDIMLSHLHRSLRQKQVSSLASISWEGSAMSEACVILNDIHIDIMDYIKPAYCNEAQFRSMWTEFEWENRVNVTTSISWCQVRQLRIFVCEHAWLAASLLIPTLTLCTPNDPPKLHNNSTAGSRSLIARSRIARSHIFVHIASAAEHLETCNRLVEKIGEVDGEVEGMLEGWRGVEEGGRSLKNACERLLEERTRYHRAVYSITLVVQTDFLYMVEHVRIGISGKRRLYLLRFRQCMTQAMTLIKMYFVASLTADVSHRISEKGISQTAQRNLLYTRLRSVSTPLSPLLGELERRANAHPEELSALLVDCHSTYFGARKRLLVSRLVEEIEESIRGGQCWLSW